MMGKKRPVPKSLQFRKNIEDDDYRDALAAFGEAKRKANREMLHNWLLPLNKKAKKRKSKKHKQTFNLDNQVVTNSCNINSNLSNFQNGQSSLAQQENHVACNGIRSLIRKNVKKKNKIMNGYLKNKNEIANVLKKEEPTVTDCHPKKRKLDTSTDCPKDIILNGHHKKRKKDTIEDSYPKGIEETVVINGYSKERKEGKVSSSVDSPANVHPKKLKKNLNGMTNGYSKNHLKLPKQQILKLDKQTIQHQRQHLPLFYQRDGFLNAVSESETLILVGETGSGKTTQIPQYLHEENLDLEGAICITQPRRVAAITIAKRVADEMDCEVGTLVGYSVRFEEACSKNTKLKFVTDGMLLREALYDPLLSKYKWVILDEAHERSVNTDALFGIVKSAQKRRRHKKKHCPLHIIIMSATMEVDCFHSYFENSMVKVVDGREHKIDILSMKEKTSDYVVACIQTLTKIQREAKEQEDVLIFLTGQEEIEYSMKYLERMVQEEEEFPSTPRLRVFPLYAALPYYKQLQVFSKTPPGMRKVIFSTNIAETSVTIPGIKYVIDSGRAKMRSYNASSGFEDLKVCKISQAQAWQRAGRAGREGPGVCYRTYTDEEFQAMKVQTVPEILRSNLTAVTLRLMAMGIKDVVNFDFIDKPKKENLVKAIETLRGLNAVELIDGTNVLTDLGKKMAYFPLEPQYAKLLINGPTYSCTEEMLTIVALLSGESVYINPSDKRDEVFDKRLKFRAMEGDHIELLNVFKAFTQSTNKKIWCRKNFLNFRNLSYAENVRRQLSEICVKNDIALVSSNGKIEPVLRCLVSGLFKNVAERDFENRKVSNYKVMASHEDARIHPASRLFDMNPDYIIFTELVKTQKTYMHMVSEVRPEYLLEFDEAYFRSKHIKKTKSVKPQYVM